MGPLAAPADVAMVRMSGSHWVPDVDVGEGVEGAHGVQSSASVGVGEDFHQVGEGCHGKGSAHRQEAHGVAHTRNLSHKRAHHLLGCPRVEAHSIGFGAGTSVNRGEASAGTGASVSAVNHAEMKNRHGVERHGAMEADGGSLCHGLVGRSVGGRGSAVGLALGGQSWTCEQQVSR